MPAHGSDKIPEYGCIIGGEERFSGEILEVRFPYNGDLVARVHQATPGDLEDALVFARNGFEKTRALSSGDRYRILYRLAELVESRSGELAEMLVNEGGKTISFARAEVQRAAETLRISAEEAKRLGGEVIALDWTPGNEGRFAITRRMPIGVVLGIVPFNFPLNLSCHKLGPAVASGNSLILKPASATPVSALLLGEMLVSAGFPERAISVVPCPGTRAGALAADPRVAFVSFTGSPDVGWGLRQTAGRKPVSLELGGIAPVIVHDDANLPFAVTRILTGGFTNAGQVCISVQRVYLHHAIYDEACRMICEGAAAMVTGDPRNPGTFVGPMISKDAADRALAVVHEAQARGARVLVGGRAEGTLFYPTVIAGTDPEMAVNSREIFAPVITLTPYETLDQALALANQVPYGLQMGIFTQNIQRIINVHSLAEYGGVQVNDIPTFRVDHMPYGGVKGSGLGREGPKYAIEEMTVPRVLAFNPAGGQDK
ncbi:MAG: NAD(P)-dependent glyceraldehyde-3-phosphate dehydrogenase [Methanoregulaceae archaeon PtaB.Bin056]|nr:MAG: NAD(P)-dependent glyceraldehyde-3-phosphate dehydrogenase [Methanoregulaceae archaeon PtaB.Bin056]